MYEHNRAKCYSQLRNLILEDDIIKCIHLVNKIKDHRHNKIRSKQIDKFEWLVRESSGYLNNFSSFDGHIPLGGHPLIQYTAIPTVELPYQFQPQQSGHQQQHPLHPST